MTIHEPAKDALIYEGNLGSDNRHGPLTKAFANVAGSSQHYRVVVEGYSFHGYSSRTSFTPQFCARELAMTVAEQNLQNEPDIEKVARMLSDIVRAAYNPFKNPRPFHDCPVIATLHKPGRIKDADEIMSTTSLQDLVKFSQEPEILSPENT